MKKKLFIALGGILLIAVIVLVVVLKSGILVKAEYSSKYTQTFGEFTAKTASKLLKNKKENTCYSPVSLFAALALTAENTEGETRKEILKGLGVEGIEELEEVYSKMLKDIQVKDEEDLKRITLCNSLWIDNEYLTEKSSEIIQKNKEKLDCDIFECDSIRPDEINEWVSEKTNNLVDKVMNDENSQQMALVNTLYYKSNWLNNFSRKGYDSFTLEGGDKVDVEYITCKEEKMSYKEHNNYTVISVPMESGEIVFILPQKGVQLEKMLKEKSINDIMALITGAELEEGYVNISFPKFNCGNDFKDELYSMLKEMGIERLLENGEWILSEGMSELSMEVIQKTKFKVDKDGIEASAATIKRKPVSIEDKNLVLDITIDRPFMYILIKDGVPLFIGTVYNPAE